MKTRNTRKSSALWRILSVALVALTVFAAFGGAVAADTPPPPAGERFAQDPYDLWPGEFLDFAPPDPDTLNLTQPNGASLKARLTPMETGGLMETTDGYSIIQDADGWWTYAQIGEAGQAVASDLVVGVDAPAGLDKKIGQTPSIWVDAQGQDVRDAIFDAVRDVQSPNNSMFTKNDVATKNYRYVVVLVQYQDVKFEPWQTREWFQAQISGLGTSPSGSVTDLYYENSYGRFMPEMDVYGPYTSSYDMVKFDYQLSGGWSVSAAINNEIGAMIKDDIDWEQYDNDKVVYTSGGQQYRSVDMVVLLHAGPGKEATGQAGQVWSHASTANFRTGYIGADGRELRIRASNTCPAIGFNIGVTAHEMGHSIGESDYYATSYNSAGDGDWDIMSGGSWMGDAPAGSNPTHFNPWSKVNQGWVETLQVTDTTLGIELLPRSVAPQIVEIPLGGSGSSSVGADERLYVEYLSNRVPGGIFDKAAHNSGLLLWHYDRGGSQNNPARLRMAIMEYDHRDGTQDMRLNFNRGEPTDPWSDTALGATPYTNPSTNRNTPLVADGSLETGWYIMNISPLGETMTFDVVQAEDVTAQVGLDRPYIVQQPVIVGTGPVDLAAKVYNLTGETLNEVSVQFLANVGGSPVLLAETTLAELPAGAPTLVTAPWATPFAGKFPLEAVATVGVAPASDTADGPNASSQGMVRVFERMAPVLIVDDDDGYTAEEAFEGALTALCIPYVLVDHTTDLATLSQYEMVIWSAGQAGRQNGQLDAQERADLKAYLDAGGKLWMSSPRLAAALAATGAAPGTDPNMLTDYFGSAYPMSSQAGGGVITGMGQPIGGSASYTLRPFPGRAIQDYLTPAESAIGVVNPLFTWSFGNLMGMEVMGDAAHNNFQVVYFGFNLSQMIYGAERLALTQQVLDRMGLASVCMIQKAGSVKITVHDADAIIPRVKLSSTSSPNGMIVPLTPTGVPGTFSSVVNLLKPGTSGRGLVTGPTDLLSVTYEDKPGHTIWDAADLYVSPSQDQGPTIYHDLISNAIDAQALPVMAVATDDVRVTRVELYYRKAGTGAFTRLVMTETSPNAWQATIPASAVTPLGMEYYLTAKDTVNHMTWAGSAAAPNFVVVQPRTLAP